VSQRATAARLMAALAAAGVPRLDVSLNWHAQIWTGRPRDRKMPGAGWGLKGPDYRTVKRLRAALKSYRR
jgi:hypothetical protein